VQGFYGNKFSTDFEVSGRWPLHHSDIKYTYRIMIKLPGSDELASQHVHFQALAKFIIMVRDHPDADNGPPGRH